MEWKPARFDKISVKVLYEHAEKGEMTCLLKLEPGLTCRSTSIPNWSRASCWRVRSGGARAGIKAAASSVVSMTERSQPAVAFLASAPIFAAAAMIISLLQSMLTRARRPDTG